MIRVITDLLLAASSSLAVSIIAKVTVTTGLALIAVWLARRSRAASRHTLLAAGFSVLLVLPITAILAPPVRISVPVIAQDETVLTSFAETIDVPSARAATIAGASPAIPQPSPFPLPAVLFAVWITGVAIFLRPVVRGLREIRSLRQSAVAWRTALETGSHRRVKVLLHHAVPGPMTCGVTHPVIVLPADAPKWEPEDLNRAIVHELEHVRRFDWLSLCVARVVCGVYWFHPMVWIAWRKLALEAERSCDDAVLARSEATAYADQLVELARRLSTVRRSPAPAMADRADLTTRVGAVLDSRQRRGRAGAFPVALACAAAALLVLTMSPLRMVAGPQAAPSQVAAIPQFDAVSVKLVDPNMNGYHSHENNDPGRLRMTGTMHMFITHAYGIVGGQLSGEPEWFRTHLYSIEAVTSARTSPDRMMLMLRAALADRFQLRLRQEDRDLAVYALEVAPGGPKFKELKQGEDPKDGPDVPGTFARSFTSMRDLMNTLNNVNGGRLSVDRPVVDRTHLTGSYNIQLRTEVETQADGFGGRESRFPSLFQDIQRDLGLKLVPDHVRMPYFVVEHAAAPTPN